MVGGRPLTLETGRLAKQADGAVLVTHGDTQVLVTACVQEPRFTPGFFPLTCDFVEKTYAAGRFPGGFFKRENRPRDGEILVARIMDRPVRPLFADGFMKDTQLIATVMSSDNENRGDVLALTGASAALHISSLPWDGPIAGVRVGRKDGELIANPTRSDLEESDLDIVVAASRDAIVMVEGKCQELTEREMADALEFAHETVQPVLDLIEELRAVVGKPKQEVQAPKLDDGLKQRVAAVVDGDLQEATRIAEKLPRYSRFDEIKAKLSETMKAELGDEAYDENVRLIKKEFDARKSAIIRAGVLDRGTRIDGRDLRTVRPITTDVGVLSRTHGSALFQRGETQAMAITTLGTTSDEQKIDNLYGERWKHFYLHYNFPPFCVGEVKFLRGPGRREIGHGNLAERALTAVLPTKEEFPYTIRVVSETLESNGSSSMAAVSGGCMSLMDAGVPIRAPVAGIAMGLISDGERHAVLTDILGDEDHVGDMDFKVCGTEKGITAIQMDIKIKGLTRQVMLEALEQARDGRLHVLSKMLETLPAPRPELSDFAPRIVTVKVKPEQIRIIIGPGGKTIKGIVDQTGVAIDVEDDGTVNIASSDSAKLRKAVELVEALTAEPEIGKVYEGVVRRVADFGAFVEILPNWDGLVHISELAHGRTERVEDVCSEGDNLTVKVISIDDGKVRLSHRETLPPPEDGVSVGGTGGGGGRPPRRAADRVGGRGGRSGGRSDRSGGRGERSGGRGERSGGRGERSGGRGERSDGRGERSDGRSDRSGPPRGDRSGPPPPRGGRATATRRTTGSGSDSGEDADRSDRTDDRPRRK